MKTQAAVLPLRSHYSSLLRTIFSVAAGIIISTSMWADQVGELEIDVRAAIIDKPEKGSKEAKANKPIEHGKIYGLLAVEEVKALEKLVKPIDEAKLVGEVRQELAKQGFQRVARGQRPQILLTIQYGRTQISNPYFGKTQSEEGVVGEGNRRTLTPGDIPAAYNLAKAGGQAKAQKAEYEKLCIRITAWENSSDPKAKAKRLWNTLMIVDDPDHRDLNVLSAKMLAAGAPYFGKDVEEPELEFFGPLPEGSVKIGTPTVVETPPEKTK